MTEATFAQPMADLPEGRSLWQRQLRVLGLVLAGVAALFWREIAEMVAIWWDVSTYNHCLLIPLIIGWLVQQRLDELAKITPTFWLPGLAVVALGSAAWLLGDAAGVALGRHVGLILVLQGVVISVLGRQVALGLTFPLLYAFFLIPVGEEIVPLLQTVTAKMSMLLLDWTGIPAYIEGVFISTPTGYFEVAEACSGVKFLIAMIAFGALVSNLCFNGWPRRIAFMALCIIVPIVANGVRAFGTIYISHYQGIEFAGGFDHIFYGWFFFAFVLIAVMAMGWRFFDRQIDAQMIDGDRLAQTVVPSVAPKKALPLLVGIVVLPFLWSLVIAAQSGSVPTTLAAPQVAGWEAVSYQPRYPWQPRYAGADAQMIQRYRNAATGETVDLAIATYATQADGQEIVGYGQGAIDPESDWAWSSDVNAPNGAHAERITAPGPVTREVLTFYQIGDTLTGSATAVKLETLKARLLGGDQRAVAVTVSAEKSGDANPRKAIDAFLADLGDVAKVADVAVGRD